ncbi:MAG: DUF4157 domain-containing protein [Moorea sp. SIO4A3]|nr:DUF4157 domain-containing protein [Moorena sp. SIO4A3]
MQIPVSSHSAYPSQMPELAPSGRNTPVQRQEEEKKAENKTGLPDRLKAGIESMSGFDLSGVRVNYNSPKPAQLNAHAYTQGQAIEVAPGQESHLPHEAWHVVQQMQGRVRQTMEVNGVGVNGDRGLEGEADVIGKRAELMGKRDKIISRAKDEAPKNLRNEEAAYWPSPSTSPKLKRYIRSTERREQKREDSSHRLMTSGNRVVQMVEKKELTQESENGKYKLSLKNTHVLYGRKGTEEPRPKGMYKTQVEKVTDGEQTIEEAIRWEPNAKLISKQMLHGWSESDINISTNPALTKDQKQVEREILKKGWLTAIKSDLAGVHENLENGVKLGIVGANDCAAFAKLMHLLIRKQRKEEGKPFKATEEKQKEEKESGMAMVGTMMLDMFPEYVEGCGYHGATVVALDGPTMVTLEAHAGKRTLQKPEFHMRNGVEGFKKDNTPDQCTEEKAEKWKKRTVTLHHPIYYDKEVEQALTQYFENSKKIEKGRDLHLITDTFLIEFMQRGYAIST